VGKVGAESITHIYPDIPGILSIRNPLPATGGVEPEPLEQIKFQAPHAFRQRQCAVTEADYAQLAQSFPGVRQAVATRRWTGSWDTIFITVDRAGGEMLDPAFRQDLLAYLEPFRLAAHSLEVDNPRFVPLDLALTVQVKSGYFRRDLQSQLQQLFSDQVQTNGQLGFFHPDRHSFGQAIYLSEIVKTAMQVAGVQSVEITRCQRLWQPPRDELATGQLTCNRLEIPVLRNDSSAPEDGRIAFELQGGLEYA
jgi:predicted phage baseplate assembly protein